MTADPTSTALGPEVDVAVVGGGLSGLVCAWRLAEQGHRVVVLEARARVGGRTWTTVLADAPVDLGGTFVGPSQDRVLALADTLGCATVPTYDAGDHLVSWRGSLRRYHGTIPRLPVGALLDVERVRRTFGWLGRRIDPAAPWRAPGAAKLDRQTLASWLGRIGARRSTVDLLAMVTKVSWGCEPGELSLLHALAYVRGCGGLDPMLDTRGGAQDAHFVGGAQSLSTALAQRLGEAVVLGAPVRAISETAGGLELRSDLGVVRAQAVVLAVPPALRAAIAIDPPPPPAVCGLVQRWPQGALSKVYAAYPTPFWRAQGLSGQALSDRGPICITFDTSPADGPGILLGFIGGADARRFDHLSPDRRRAEALAAFAALFGPEAEQPIATVEQRWSAEPFSGGGPTAAVPPGAWTAYGSSLRVPVGRIVMAGTETATRWSGFMDGAVRAGEQAATDVVTLLGG